ncbi:MAG: DUF6174 domain-containing protein, partial [Pirellulales bacterium]
HEDKRAGRLRKFWWWLLIGSLPLAACLFFFMARRPSLPELTESQLREAEERWQAAGATNYNLQIQLGESQAGQVEVEVRRGQVTKMVRDGHVPARRQAWDVWSVAGQFDMLSRELEMASDPAGQAGAAPGTRLLLEAEFHTKLGYPIHFRRLVLGRGLPDVAWDVTQLEIVP